LGLRHIRVTSKHELRERIMAGIDDVNRYPVIHTWSYKLAEGTKKNAGLGLLARPRRGRLATGSA